MCDINKAQPSLKNKYKVGPYPSHTSTATPEESHPQRTPESYCMASKAQQMLLFSQVSKEGSFFFTTNSNWLLAVEYFLVALLQQGIQTVRKRCAWGGGGGR